MHSRPGGGIIGAPKGKVLASQWPNQCLAHPSGVDNWVLPSKSTSHYLIFKHLLPQAWPSANMVMLQRSICWIFRKYYHRPNSLTLPAQQTKSTFVHCHLAATTESLNYQNSCFLHCHNVLMGPGLGVGIHTHGTGITN